MVKYGVTMRISSGIMGVCLDLHVFFLNDF